MHIPENTTVPSLFFGNYFCFLSGHNAAFVAIHKNGTTFLKKLALYLKTGEIIEDVDHIHHEIGYDHTSDHLIHVSQMQAFEKENGIILKFAVWRDPVERLVSFYKHFILEQKYRYYLHFLDLYHDNSFERFIEFVEFELKKSVPEYQDEHIRRQIDHFQNTDLDYIVPIQKLNKFLEEKGIPLIEDKANKTTAKFKIPLKKWEDKIKKLYQTDYSININY